MKRFVDLRFQGTNARFAFWDTVTSTFDDYGAELAWKDWDEFEEWFRIEADNAGDLGWNEEYLTTLLQRYRSLCPTWVFDEPTERELGFCDEADDYIDVVVEDYTEGWIGIEDANGNVIDMGQWVSRGIDTVLRIRLDRLVDYIGHRPSLDRIECAAKTLEWIGSTLNLLDGSVPLDSGQDIVASSEYVARHPEMLDNASTDRVDSGQSQPQAGHRWFRPVLDVLADNAPVELAVGGDSVQPVDSTHPDDRDSNQNVAPSADSDD